jgi:hypothetical protein
MQLRRKLAVVAVAGAASVALAAGIPALASSHASAGKSVTGPEVIAGTVHGRKALPGVLIIPLRWRGLVHTSSVIGLGFSGSPKGSVRTFRSPAGKLTVKGTGKPHISQAVSTRTCRFSATEDDTFRVVGSKSTGAFAAASGPGAVQISVSAHEPRYASGPKKGQCNPAGPLRARGAVATFLASLVLVVK